MTRYIYGADGSAQVVSMSGAPTTAAATVKTTRTGGSTVTDILDLSGTALAGIVHPDAHGQIVFQGPDGALNTYWLDFGDGGPRWAVNVVDHQGAITSVRAALMAAENSAPGGYTAKAQIPYTPGSVSQAMATLLDPLVIPRAASASARNTLFPTPANGDTCYRTDLGARQTYRNLLGGAPARWVTEMALIGEVDLTATQTSITFAGIPQEWRHLLIKYKAQAVGSLATGVKVSYLGVRFNGDTAGNYAYSGSLRVVKPVSGSYGSTSYEVARDGSGGGASGGTPVTFGGTTAGLTNFNGVAASSTYVGMIAGSDFSTQFAGGEIAIEDYTDINTNKSIAGRSGMNNNTGATATGYQARLDVEGGWQSTAAITQIDIIAASATSFASGSYFSLYGLS